MTDDAIHIAPSSAEDYINVQGPLVSAYLEQLFSSEHVPDALFRSMRYSLLAGGKRLRPVMCLAVGKSFGVVESDLLPVAAALEILHTYSLIHDDLPCMDDDDLRRGQPTNHKVFGEATALLSGDALLTFAFEQIAKPLPIPASRQLEMVRALANAAGCYGMVAGQVADLEGEGQAGSMAQLEFIHLHKTARLIEVSVLLGGLYAGVSDTVRDALCAYGRAIGLAFQVADDLLDVIGDTEQLGKTVGSDERLEKLTYPKLVGIQETKRLMMQLHDEAVMHLKRADIPAPLLRAIAAFVVKRAK